MRRRVNKAAGGLLRTAFASLAPVKPVSKRFGFDRGLPIDRFYIEDFLGRHSADIYGRTLEVGDDEYTKRYGGTRTRQRDTIHIDPAVPATIHGDMTLEGVLPTDTFDCAVITQTLHMIYDVRSAVMRLHDSLKPGGMLLLTVPGITPIAGDRWGKTWYWSLTQPSLVRLLEEQFGPDSTSVSCYGNVFAATAFLYGLAAHEVPTSRLDVFDPRYPVILGARAQRRM
jgi:SAM-dependent methyltransferase